MNEKAKKTKIVAVVATYRRDDCLQRLMDALAGQTLRLHQDAKTSAKLVEACDETVTMAQRYGLREKCMHYARRMRYGGCCILSI